MKLSVLKHQFKLRKGDLIINEVCKLAGIITRKTDRYIYYFIGNLELRIEINKAWKSIDEGRLRIGYSSMKYRRKKRNDRHLDLHGIKHVDAPEKIRQYLNWVELPTKIITGSSTTMKRIAREIVEEYDYKQEDDPVNFGCLIIFEK